LFQQDLQQDFFGDSDFFPVTPLCGIDAVQRASSLGRGKQAVGG
jgi:hypothetical protein